MWKVILWFFAGTLTIANMEKTDGWQLKFSYIVTWIVLMVNLICKYMIT